MSQTKISPEQDNLVLQDIETPPTSPPAESKQETESTPSTPPSAETDPSSKNKLKKTMSLSSEGDLDIDDDELEKLVPVLLEDASDGNLKAVTQILNLDLKTPNFSIAMATDDEGRHALHRAALEGRSEIVSLLLERYSDKTNKKGIKYIDVPDNYGNTALFLVCIRLDKSDAAQAQFLMDAGASVEIVKTTDFMTILHWASHHGNKNLVLAILNHHKLISKENPTKKLILMVDKDNRTPIDVCGLQFAQKWVEADDAMRGDSLHDRTVSSLSDFSFSIRHLSNPGLINFYKPTKVYWNRCLFWCAATGHEGGIESALSNGASPRWKNPLVNNQSCLHMAVSFGSSIKAVEIIMTALKDDKSNQPLYKMTDGDNNNPLHHFVLGTTNKYHKGDVGGRKQILDLLLTIQDIALAGDKTSLLKNRELLESARNRNGFRPVDYIPGLETDSATYEMLKTAVSPYYKKILENESALAFEWVLVFAKGAEIDGFDTQYKKVCEKLRENDQLLADIMPSPVKPDKEVFVMVGCTDGRLRNHAEKLQYEVQLLTSREYRKYEVEDDHLFLPFRSQERMEIIMQKMQEDCFDVDAYLECGVLLRTFPLHDPNERELVKKLWLPKIHYWLLTPFSTCWCNGPCRKDALPPFSFCSDLRKEGSHLSFEHLSVIKMYMGEKIAFYYAWYSHYTLFLAYAAFPGVIVLIVQLIQVLDMGVEGIRTPLIPFFCVWMASWTTIQNESWKRKSSELAYRWDVMDAAEKEELRPEFRGDECINTATGKIEKYYPEEVRRRKQYASVPVVFTFVAAAIIAFISAKMYKETFAVGEMALIQGLVASVINSVAIVVLDQVYKRLALFMTDLENHRYESEYESALVSKTFWFMLVNNTAPLCWAAFHDRHLFNLFKQTAITLVSKQMTNVIKDVVLPIMKSKKAQRKVDKDLANPDGILFDLVYGDVDEACLKLNPDHLSNLDGTDVKQAREEVIANAVMDGNGGIVSEYAELVIQFAFTTLFACAFPGGPAIVLAINMIGLRGELFVGLYATQRPETLTAGSIIEAWADILEIIGYMAILCNVLILVFTFDMELGWIKMENVTSTNTLIHDVGNFTYDSTELKNVSNDWWLFLTGRIRINQVYAMVILEHILIIAKMGLSGCIEDEPAWVTDAIKRETWEKEARTEMAERRAEQLEEQLLSGNSGMQNLKAEVLESVANFEVVKTPKEKFVPAPPPPPGGATFLPGNEAKKQEVKADGDSSAAEKVA